MALLADSPRTATVVAETDVIAWRLSRTRFDTLLDHERDIAREHRAVAESSAHGDEPRGGRPPAPSASGW